MYIGENNKRDLLQHDSTLNVITGALVLLLLTTTYSQAPEKMMNPNTLRILTNNNIYVKYFITFCIIYFVIDFSYQDTKHPLYEFFISLCILGLYIIYSKIHHYFQISILVLLIIIYFLNDIINYHTQRSNSPTLIKKYTVVKYWLISITCILLGVGYVL